MTLQHSLVRLHITGRANSRWKLLIWLFGEKAELAGLKARPKVKHLTFLVLLHDSIVQVLMSYNVKSLYSLF